MTQIAERKGFKIESTLPQKKKTKDKKVKSKGVEHVRIIDDDVPIPLGTIVEPVAKADEDIISYDDAPVVVGIIDERPPEIREKERFKDAKRWRTKAFEEVPEPGTIGPQPKSAKTSSSSTSRQKQNSSDDSDPEIDRRRPRKHDDPDLSPPRRKSQHKDDDPSPPRRRRQLDDDPSPPRRNRDDSSPPPPRKRLPQRDDDASPPSRHDSSPPPRRKQKYNDDLSLPRRRDTSPPRKRPTKDDDSSPPRHRDRSSPSHRKNDRHSRQESSPSSTHRRQPKNEPSSPSTARRSKQESSPPPSQPAKSERRRLAEHKEQLAERYAHWGRGLAQVRRVEDAVKDYIEQAEKPLARYRDDKDLDVMLKEREREDDPMLKYLSNKTSDAGDRTNNSSSAPAKPRYRGPEPQKNRFDIWPGYRWDGVDRSNGYEKKLFESIASRHAKSQEAYLWSVEDM